MGIIEQFRAKQLYFVGCQNVVLIGSSHVRFRLQPGRFQDLFRLEFLIIGRLDGAAVQRGDRYREGKRDSRALPSRGWIDRICNAGQVSVGASDRHVRDARCLDQAVASAIALYGVLSGDYVATRGDRSLD